MQASRDMKKNAETAALEVRSELAQRLQALLQQKSTLDQYFDRKPGTAEISADTAAVGSESTQPSSSSSASTMAPAAEQRQASLESCAAASAAASAAEQRQQETTTAASAAKPVADQLQPALRDDGDIFRRRR